MPGVPDWALPVVLALIPALFGFGSVWLGHKTRRQFGLPTPMDQMIEDQELRLRESLAASEARCQADLAEARAELHEEEDKTEKLTRKLGKLELRYDDAQRHIGRLERRIDKLEGKDGT